MTASAAGWEGAVTAVSAAREVAPRSGVTRLAWAVCILSVALALAGVALAA